MQGVKITNIRVYKTADFIDWTLEKEYSDELTLSYDDCRDNGDMYVLNIVSSDIPDAQINAKQEINVRIQNGIIEPFEVALYSYDNNCKIVYRVEPVV
jgi:hypothetical protein